MNHQARWLEISITVDAELVEPITSVFQEYGQGGVLVEEDLEILPEEEGIRRHPERPVRVTTYLPGDDLAGERLQRLQTAVGHLHAIWPLPELSLKIVDQEDWANAWKEHFPVHRIGRRTVIKPSWRAYSAQPNDLVIELDPGLAFGTGLHPTTQTCAELLEDLVRPGCRALDLGTGSAILAIQLARLGAASVDAWEVDPTAVAVAADNVRLNQVDDRVAVRAASLPGTRDSGRRDFAVCQPEAAYDLIVANIIANVIIDRAPALFAALAPGGDCVVSGIIAERLEEVLERIRSVGFHVQRIVERGDWRTLHLRRSRA